MMTEVRMSRVGVEGRGELVVWLVTFAWTRACVKARLQDDPDPPDQQNCKAKKKKEWLSFSGQ